MREDRESEALTRKRRVDKHLRASGWEPILKFSALDQTPDKAAVEELPTQDGPADYVLFFAKEAAAVVEAKRISKGPQNVLSQAQRYARGYDGPKRYQGEFAVPFAYSTNGEAIWFQDLRSARNLSRPVQRFHTPQALHEMLTKDAGKSLAWLSDNAPDEASLWPFQHEAVEAVENALRAGKRQMLVAMATGTGKTRTTVAMVYRLLRSGLAKRVLFLVDRRALAAQAMQQFSSFETPNNRKFSDEYEVYGQRFQSGDIDEDDHFDPKVLDNSYLTDPDPRKAFVYVSTIQRMRINLFGRPEGFYGTDTEDEPDADILDIPIHAFDLIIADECHRGYTSSEDSKWREVLQHFDCAQIGLTATPAPHTVAYFKDVVYRYSLDRAVQEGYLVDYEAIKVQSAFRQQGIFLQEGEEVTLIDSTTGEHVFDTLEDERQLAPEAVEQNWTSVDANRKIIRAYLDLAHKHEAETGRFPKTLFFADNDLPHTSHADLLVRLLREELAEGDAPVVKITGNSDRPLRLIKQLRNRPEPRIAVTVDLLSTGVDIRPLEFIVIVRPIKSRILFEQIMGRGTRTCKEINKTHFVVMDCVDVLGYFRNASAFAEYEPVRATRPFAEIVEDVYRRKDYAYNVKVLVKRLQRIAKGTTGEGLQRFRDIVASCPNLSPELSQFADQLPKKLESDWHEAMALLRDPALLDFVEHYPRPPRSFIVDEYHEDTVTAEEQFGGFKPQDYIETFERFVRANADHIEELKILLKRPEHFTLKDLEELRRKLRATPENFSEHRLRAAYGRPLADIISLVRHAATGEPIMDQSERVDKAIDSVVATLRNEGPYSEHTARPEQAFPKVADGASPTRELTKEQSQWIELIREHLHSNLLISPEDLQLPSFAERGATKRRLERAFGEDLRRFMQTVNEAVAARGTI
jgi:type I restriction enzyme R subunit